MSLIRLQKKIGNIVIVQVARQVESTECKQVPRQNEVNTKTKTQTKKDIQKMYDVVPQKVENCRDIARQQPREECETIPKEVCENVPKQVGK